MKSFNLTNLTVQSIQGNILMQVTVCFFATFYIRNCNYGEDKNRIESQMSGLFNKPEMKAHVCCVHHFLLFPHFVTQLSYETEVRHMQRAVKRKH